MRKTQTLVDSLHQTIGNWADNNALVRAPAIDMMGATVNLGVEYSLQADGDTTNDGGVLLEVTLMVMQLH